jgi:TRAP-type C4-dicarboxylate transport system permease large subunit
MPVILLYGIYGGVTTPTEAAAVAALLRAACWPGCSTARCPAGALRHLRRKRPSSAAVGLVIGGALILNFVVGQENIPGMVADALVGSTCTRWCSC